MCGDGQGLGWRIWCLVRLISVFLVTNGDGVRHIHLVFFMRIFGFGCSRNGGCVGRLNPFQGRAWTTNPSLPTSPLILCTVPRPQNLHNITTALKGRNIWRRSPLILLVRDLLDEEGGGGRDVELRGGGDAEGEGG